MAERRLGLGASFAHNLAVAAISQLVISPSEKNLCDVAGDPAVR
jgi:hypothetical protein